MGEHCPVTGTLIGLALESNVLVRYIVSLDSLLTTTLKPTTEFYGYYEKMILIITLIGLPIV